MVHRYPDERSVSVLFEGGDADSIYQTLLMNGLVVGSSTGETIQLPPETLAGVDEMVGQIDVVTQLKRLARENGQE
jgi:hypothetical protein